jgi:hypothetical protein
MADNARDGTAGVEDAQATDCAIWSLCHGVRKVTVPWFEYGALDHERDQQRFLVLLPAVRDKNEPANHVQCRLIEEELFDAEPFVAVRSARGYRLHQDLIEIDGTALAVSQALERFMRNFRRDVEPVRLWIRHICVNEQDAQEKSRYWTRDFSDTMYALATDTIDMCDYNNRLLDEGKIERVLAPEHMTWTKQWHEAPDSITFPRIFPVELGRRPSNHDPQDEFRYVPLDMVSDEIRVVVLTPSPDSAAPIVCHLGHCPAHCEVTFVGLSYTWGKDTSTSTIILNGQKMNIRSTLAAILRDLRKEGQAVPIWIDAICINQDDIEERDRQLPRMARIYDCAAGVVSYTGSASSDSDLALELVTELQHPMMRFNNQHEWHFGEWRSEGDGMVFGENRIKPLKLAEMAAALYKFLTRRYFRRVWVLQELALASNPRIAVGANTDTPFERRA